MRFRRKGGDGCEERKILIEDCTSLLHKLAPYLPGSQRGRGKHWLRRCGEPCVRSTGQKLTFYPLQAQTTPPPTPYLPPFQTQKPHFQPPTTHPPHIYTNNTATPTIQPHQQHSHANNTATPTTQQHQVTDLSTSSL